MAISFAYTTNNVVLLKQLALKGQVSNFTKHHIVVSELLGLEKVFLGFELDENCISICPPRRLSVNSVRLTLELMRRFLNSTKFASLVDITVITN